MADETANGSLLAERVRQADPDRYLTVLYAPANKRDALQAIYAFNAEIAHIRDVVREPVAGEIRLQWWRDALTGQRLDEAAGNPLAAALLDTIDRYDLPRAAFDRYLQARLFDLYDEEFPDRNALEGYCGETAGAVIQLASLILDRDAAPGAGDAAGHAGCAQAIAGLLRSLPLHRARGQCHVPASVLADNETDRDRFLAGTDKAAVERVVEAMTVLAREHLNLFEARADNLPRSLLPAYLPLAPVGAYLDRLERRKAAALEQVVDITPIRRNWLVMKRAITGF